MIFRTPRMEQIIGTIPSRTLSLLLDFPGWSGRVLDLGCGDASFDYQAFPHASVVAVDRTLTDGVTSKHATGIVAEPRTLPLKSGRFDVVVMNHALEHLPQPEIVLSEARRLLHDRGFLYVSIPNGRGFDDWLYRSLYSLCGFGKAGHGHINRFTFDSFLKLSSDIGFEIVYYCDWFSAFTYLPDHPRWSWLGWLQKPFIEITRFIDGMFNSDFSRYGWMFLLQKR